MLTEMAAGREEFEDAQSRRMIEQGNLDERAFTERT